MVAVNTNRLRL